MKIELNDLVIQKQADQVRSLAANMLGEKVEATITSFVFTNDEGCVLLAGLHEFDDGTALFSGIELINGPAPYQRAIQAGRVEVKDWQDDQYSSRIKVFKSESGEHPNLAGLTWDDFSKLADVADVQTLLREYGAVALGTAGDILAVANRTKNQLAMTYPRGDIRSLAVMWGVTRITAIAKKFGSTGYAGQ